MTNQTIYEALSVIKEVCLEQAACATCPLRDRNDYDTCMFNSEDLTPDKWTLNNPSEWTAI